MHLLAFTKEGDAKFQCSISDPKGLFFLIQADRTCWMVQNQGCGSVMTRLSSKYSAVSSASGLVETRLVRQKEIFGRSPTEQTDATQNHNFWVKPGVFIPPGCKRTWNPFSYAFKDKVATENIEHSCKSENHDWTLKLVKASRVRNRNVLVSQNAFTATIYKFQREIGTFGEQESGRHHAIVWSKLTSVAGEMKVTCFSVWTTEGERRHSCRVPAKNV